MKKILSSILVTIIISLSVVNTYAAAPTEADTPVETKELKYYNYDVATGTVTEETFNFEDNPNATQATSSSSANLPYLNRTTFEERNVEQRALTPYGPVNNPENYLSFRNVVYLDIVTSDSKHKSGSGFLIGPSVVATSAHALYNSGYAGNHYATGVTVAPAATGNSYPYEVAYATNLFINTDFITSNAAQDDWALIYLDRNIGDQTGWLGFQTQTASYNGTSVTAAGYPNNVNRIMYRSLGTITTSQTGVLKSTNMTITKGMSGGPVFIYSASEGYIAIAIIQGGPEDISTTNPTFTRITNTVYQFFVHHKDRRV